MFNCTKLPSLALFSECFHSIRMTDDFNYIYYLCFFITNKNQAGNWMYRSNLNLRLKVLDRYILVIRQIGDLWHWGCFLENIYLDKKYYLLNNFFLNHIMQNIIYTNYVSGIENEEAEVWRVHEGPSPHHEFRNDSLFWKLNHKHSHQVRSYLLGLPVNSGGFCN